MGVLDRDVVFLSAGNIQFLRERGLGGKVSRR